LPPPPDDFDARLVRALQREGRASHLDLARDLGVSRALVAARLRDLLAGGTVRVVAAVDPGLIGQHVMAHVSIEVSTAAEPVAHWLTELPEAVLVSVVGGRPAIVVELRVATHDELADVLARVRAREGVAAIASRIYTRVLKGFFMPEYRVDVPVDGIDQRLITALQADGRTSYRELADLVGLSATTVRARVTRLLDARVIKISAVEVRGVYGRQLSMGVGLDLAEVDDALLGHLAGADHVEFAAQTAGACDLIATITAQSPVDLLERIDTLRRLPGVRRLEAWTHLRLLKEDYTRGIPAP